MGKEIDRCLGYGICHVFFLFSSFLFFYSGVVIKEVKSESLSSRTFLKMMMVILRIDDEMK